MNIGPHSGGGGGAGDGPPVNQSISACRDNPNGPEKQKANLRDYCDREGKLSFQNGQVICRLEEKLLISRLEIS